MPDDLRDAERAKYDRMWSVHEYRRHSPGEHAVGAFANTFGLISDVKGRTVIDFGCGTGRATLRLQQLGAQVLGFDLTESALDESARGRFPFIEGCLWDFPPDLKSEFGFCVDVMEHIPSARVRDVLEAIKGAVLTGVFFQIATFQDGFGDVIGERLHLTVRTAPWWRAELSDVWPNVIPLNGSRRQPQFWCSR